MRSFHIIHKETKAFIKDWKSLSLLFIAPIILVLVVSSAFILTTPKNIDLLICGTDNSELYRSLVSLSQNSGIFNVRFMVQGDACEQIINNNIRNSQAEAGVIVPATTSLNTKIQVITDNSKLISDFIVSYFKIISNDLSDRIVTKYIAQAYTNVETAKQDLNFYENKLVQQQTFVKNARIKINAIRNSLNDLKGNIQNYNSNVNFILNDINNVSNSLSLSKSSLENSASVLDASVQPIQESNMTESTKNSLVNSLTSTSLSLKSNAQNLENARARLADALNTLQSSRNNINSQTIDQAIFNLNEMDTFLQNTELSINEALERYRPFKQALLGVGFEAPETTQVVEADIRGYFGQGRLIDFIFPSVLIMTLMLISTFTASLTLMRQRASGLLDRLAIAPGGCGFVVFEKTVTNIILTIIPIPFMVLITSGLLNLELFLANFPITLLILVLSVIIFVSIGMVIASFSNSESTAILLALLIIVPMMFLSGIFIPAEKLPDEIYSVSKVLPLTLANSILQQASFYNIIPFDSAALLLFYVIIALFASYIVLKRSLIK